MRTSLPFVALALAISIAGCGGSPASPPGDGGAIPACVPVPTMPATTFCQIYLPSCGTTRTGYTSLSECVASYGALTSTKPMRQACQSRHLCQAADAPAGDERDRHCVHSTGAPGNGECEQTD